LDRIISWAGTLGATIRCPRVAPRGDSGGSCARRRRYSLRRPRSSPLPERSRVACALTRMAAVRLCPPPPSSPFLHRSRFGAGHLFLGGGPGSGGQQMDPPWGSPDPRVGRLDLLPLAPVCVAAAVPLRLWCGGPRAALAAWLGRGAPAQGRLGGADGLPVGAAFLRPSGAALILYSGGTPAPRSTQEGPVWCPCARTCLSWSRRAGALVVRVCRRGWRWWLRPARASPATAAVSALRRRWQGT
jgi:hypothetical protein